MTTDIQINCFFPTESCLYMAYMPVLKGGGIFVHSSQILSLGTRVNLVIRLLNESEIYKVEAKVAWITPRGSQGNKPEGLGFQFLGENCRTLTNKIEKYLTGLLKSSQLTDTM